MFIGREKELAVLEDLYNSSKFEFLVMYGRRRVGKTSLLQQFAQGKKTIFFSAQEKNDSLNLSDFSKTAQTYFDENYFGSFDGWKSAVDYISNKAGKDRLLLIIDEFPFIAAENPSFKSILQHTIDHSWKNKNIFLILCGSSVSFMENEVMGYKSPLYGRLTAQINLKPFDYFDSACFFPHYSNLDKILSYGILGGIPCYLECFNDLKSVEENLVSSILHTSAFMKEEPQVLLRMEFREPAVYNSIFEAIAGGASRLNDISERIHEESQKCSKYLSTLQAIRLVEKITPAGEKESSRKTIYRISDNYFLFWYHFIFRDRSYLELVGPQKAASEIMKNESISTYMGAIFEQICCQYMIRRAKKQKLPFAPYSYGKWWGNNSRKKMQDDIDILMLDRNKESGIFCECKFRKSLFDKLEFEDLISVSESFMQVKNKYYFIFSKSGFTNWVKNQASEHDNITLITLDDLFDI